MISAIVLAAGASNRMGAPKALLRYGGMTFLEHILDATLAAGLARRVVVLGHDSDKVLSSLTLEGVTVVKSRALAAGPIGSIRAGIEAVLNHPVEAALVWHVDQPHVEVATIVALTQAFRETGLPIVVPVLGGKRGHPVVFGRRVFKELLSAPDEQGARAVVRSDAARVAEVEVTDQAILEDINTPEAYHKLLQRHDHAARPPGKTQ
jgi:molybdenum cofactor cytidylyltransferase